MDYCTDKPTYEAYKVEHKKLLETQNAYHAHKSSYGSDKSDAEKMALRESCLAHQPAWKTFEALQQKKNLHENFGMKLIRNMDDLAMRFPEMNTDAKKIFYICYPCSQENFFHLYLNQPQYFCFLWYKYEIKFQNFEPMDEFIRKYMENWLRPMHRMNYLRAYDATFIWKNFSIINDLITGLSAMELKMETALFLLEKPYSQVTRLA